MLQIETTDEELRAVLSAWLSGALLSIEGNLSELVSLIEMPKWHVEPDGSFVKYQHRAFWHFSKLDEVLFGTNEPWLDVLRVATRHSNFMQHTDQLIGATHGMKRTYSLEEICKLLLPIPTAVERNKISVDTRLNVAERVGSFLVEINAPIVRTKTFWPIVGISTDSPITLDELTEFRELTDEEKLTCLDMEMIKPHGQDQVDPASAKWFGLCKYTDNTKVFGETVFDGNDFTKYINERDQILDDFLTIIPVISERTAFHAGGFHSAPTFETGGIFVGGVMAQSATTSSIRFLIFDESSILSDPQKQELIKTWPFIRDISGSKYKKQIVNAMRRLYYAETRLKSEDKLVDYMVAAESLYLDKNDKAELSYRASLNASMWSDVPRAEKNNIFMQFRNAYSLRSNIVHGSTVSTEEVRVVNEQIKPVLRNAITKALHHLDTEDSAPDWVALIFALQETD